MAYHDDCVTVGRNLGPLMTCPIGFVGEMKTSQLSLAFQQLAGRAINMPRARSRTGHYVLRQSVNALFGPLRRVDETRDKVAHAHISLRGQHQRPLPCQSRACQLVQKRA